MKGGLKKKGVDQNNGAEAATYKSGLSASAIAVSDDVRADAIKGQCCERAPLAPRARQL